MKIGSGTHYRIDPVSARKQYRSLIGLGTDAPRVAPMAGLNGSVSTFNGKFCDELLNGEIFYTLREAQVFAAATIVAASGLISIPGTLAIQSAPVAAMVRVAVPIRDNSLIHTAILQNGLYRRIQIHRLNFLSSTGPLAVDQLRGEAWPHRRKKTPTL